MHATFLFDEELKTVCNVHLDKVLTSLAELKTINDNLVELLDDERWEGDKHDKCAASIRVIEKYRVDIENLCSTLKINIDNVVTDANTFVTNSDKVSSIKGV